VLAVYETGGKTHNVKCDKNHFAAEGHEICEKGNTRGDERMKYVGSRMAAA
jgi:hypothetical protein